MMSFGLLPRDLAQVRVEADMRSMSKEIEQLAEAHEMSDAFIDDILAMLRRHRPCPAVRLAA